MPNQHEDLISRAKRGDKNAFGEIYKEFVSRIYRYVFYLVSESTIAEDITQETFLKAWKSLPRFSFEKGTVQSFLYAIARNSVIDYQRKKKESRLDMDYAVNINSNENLEERLLNLERVSNVQKALSKLSKEDRDLVVLRYFEELSYKEIGKVLGKKEGAVRIQIHRIVKGMKGLFERKDL